MKGLLNIIFNGIFLFAVIIIALAISTLAITKKINDYSNQYSFSLSGSVVKKTIPVISFSKGIVEKIKVNTGDEVKKGETLIRLVNPPLSSEVEALKEFPDNVSAQTQLRADEEQLKMLTIKSPSDGIVGDITASEGSVVDTFTKLLTLYSSDNIQFLANLTVDEYQAVVHSGEIKAYSERLNRSFIIIPGVINPNAKEPSEFGKKKIGLYFKFKNKKDALSLLNNEDLSIRLDEKTTRGNLIEPIAVVVRFWNKILPGVR